MARALERHDACLRGAIESHGGTVFKTIGDAFQAAFPDPLAALHAAADAGRALAAEERIVQWRWRDAYELPERGALAPKLAALAYGMQATDTDGEQSQVRVDYDTALGLLDHAEGEAIVKAGLAISVLDEDPAADEVLYRHQLLQEYFAARVLAREPAPELVAAAWRGGGGKGRRSASTWT